MTCRQCCGPGCRYHGRHGQRSCMGCQEAAMVAIANGRPLACAQCGRRDPSGRVDERQTKQFFCSGCWAAYESDRLKEFFDTKPELEVKCEKLAQMISKARHVIAFTGAGVSTGAGIADFRSGMNTSLPTGPGLWERPKGETPSNILEQCVQARPGPTHGFLFRLWKVGVLKHIISQNVDGLHRKSGITADALSELHGNIFVERCVKCGREYERDFNTICSGGFTGRDCDAPGCGGRLRHSGVGFGDDLPQKVLQKAWEEAEAADLCLALGSSITVAPASDMPAWVAQRNSRRRDAGLVIVNLQATPCDSIAALRINGMVDDVMGLLEAKLVQRAILPCRQSSGELAGA
ncbi:NAD-dependent protein deacetylase SRT1 [Symbiodinium microadriaticum]|uniref:NAD-dependent protein deacetylase SRT1 n=1 Tax=Symbiodinium microadriaticum TaxID=2951 RepID=A0A1Q9DQW8_SYMMI|nr:NAD-dependent protein deacetylase SRT1 [Symbiodinium microadriaticum]